MAGKTSAVGATWRLALPRFLSYRKPALGAAVGAPMAGRQSARRVEGVKSIRRLTAADEERLAAELRASWGSTRVASRGRLHDALRLPGFVAVEGERWLGHTVYEDAGAAMEVVVLDTTVPRQGVGSALLAACVELAARERSDRLWLITTNDNTEALRFYQRRGFRLAALRPGAVDEARRRLKPEIPVVGQAGIPIRDEIELELPPIEWDGYVERHRWPSS